MGFFTRSEKKRSRRKGAGAKRGRAPALDVTKCNDSACEVCTLAKEDINSPRMKPSGSPEPLIYILGEAPGAWEDADGQQFVGRSGRYIRKQFPRAVMQHIRFNNSVRCRPPGNRAPTPLEVECCRMSIRKDIERRKPKVVVGVGDVALRWVTGQAGIKKWCGRYIPIRIGEHACWFMPILHPAYVLRAKNGNDKEGLSTEWADVFETHCAKISADVTLDQLGQADPEDLSHLYDGIEIIESNRRGLKRLKKRLRQFDAKAPLIPVGIDLETHRLRPYHDDSAILSFSLSDGARTIVVPLEHPEATWDGPSRKEVLRLLGEWLRGPCIKIAHNAPFEMEWLAEFIGSDIPRACSWDDTMVQAFILDERKGAMSLDFLTLQYFGFNLKSQSDVDRNKLRDTPLQKVLLYNGLDAKYTARLDAKQRERLEKEGLLGDYHFHMKRLPSIVLAQQIGLPVDQKQVAKFDVVFTARMKKTTKAIMALPEVKRYEKDVGPYNPGSPKQLIKLLADYTKEGRKTEVQDRRKKGRHTTGKATLALIRNPIAKLTLRFRDIAKQHGTYITNLLPGGECLYPDGRVHTSFNTTFTATRRLSSDNPNVQNFPMRKHAEIRSVIMAPPGCSLLSSDYGQIEARIIAMASKDKFLLKALRERYDIHMSWAKRIAKASPSVFTPYKEACETKEKAWAKFRSDVKNKWVFPAFYGSICESMAKRLALPLRIAQRLFDEFWDEFSGVYKWQDQQLAFYEENQYIETLTGHRRRAPLSRNMILNSGIQGTAADLVVDAGDRLSELAEEQGKPWLQWVMNIHDDLTFAIPNARVESALMDIIPAMLQPKFDWVIAPISVDMSIGPNWFEKEKIGTFHSDELAA